VTLRPTSRRIPLDSHKKAGTRELILSPLPWIVTYTVRDDAIDIVRILHGAQRWP